MRTIEKVRADLAYRLPGSGKPLAYVVLTRDEAERLVAEFGEMANGIAAMIKSDEEVTKARAAFHKVFPDG